MTLADSTLKMNFLLLRNTQNLNYRGALYFLWSRWTHLYSGMSRSLTFDAVFIIYKIKCLHISSQGSEKWTITQTRKAHEVNNPCTWIVVIKKKLTCCNIFSLSKPAALKTLTKTLSESYLHQSPWMTIFRISMSKPSNQILRWVIWKFIQTIYKMFCGLLRWYHMI